MVTLRIWHDDVRQPPDDTWAWCQTNHDAMLKLRYGGIEEISLDHDLGAEVPFHNQHDTPNENLRGSSPDGSGYDLVRWMVTHRLVPSIVRIHSWNPVGAERMANALREAG